MSASKLVVGGVLGAALLMALASKASASEPAESGRRKVVGKSGHTWFTSSEKDSGNAILVRVYESERGSDLVISYNQVTGPTAGAKVGDRFLAYESPTSLAATAKADFLRKA